jgi:carboxylesterase type B
VSLYALDDANTAQEQAVAVANFATDIVFAQAAKAFAQAWQGSSPAKALLSHFTCPNPWEGGWKGYATHGLDAAFVLQNFSDFLPAGQKACAERMGKDMVNFVTGKDGLPWVGTNGGTEIVYGVKDEGDKDESRTVSSDEAATSTARRREFEGVVGGSAEVLDRLLDAVGMLLSGQ